MMRTVRNKLSNIGKVNATAGRSIEQSGNPGNSSSSGGGPAGSRSGTGPVRPGTHTTRPLSALREKPPLPEISDANLPKYYSDPLPSFRDVPPSEKQYLFVQKLHMCSFTFDFTDPSRNVREKEMKRQTLLELVDYANSGTGKFTENVSEDIAFMLRQNLFRTLPPARSHDVENLEAEEEEPSLDPAWPHLQVRLPCVAARIGSHEHHCSSSAVQCSVRGRGVVRGRVSMCHLRSQERPLPSWTGAITSRMLYSCVMFASALQRFGCGFATGMFVRMGQRIAHTDSLID